MLLTTNTNAGTILRQVAFDKSVQRHLGGALYIDRIERYQRDNNLGNDDYTFSEKDLVKNFKDESREMKRYILDAVRDGITHDTKNSLKDYIDFGGRNKEDFRIKLLKKCNIHAIVSLNKFAFAPYTKEKTYVLFMQKKQEREIGKIQSKPIWHFILDYDGYANSDKRYRTKYHDDIPELEEHFNKAIETALYSTHYDKLKDFERC